MLVGRIDWQAVGTVQSDWSCPSFWGSPASPREEQGHGRDHASGIQTQTSVRQYIGNVRDMAILVSEACSQQHQVNIHFKKRYITQLFPGELSHMMFNAYNGIKYGYLVIELRSTIMPFGVTVHTQKSKCKNAPNIWNNEDSKLYSGGHCIVLLNVMSLKELILIRFIINIILKCCFMVYFFI